MPLSLEALRTRLIDRMRHGAQLGLDRVVEALGRMGDPQRTFRVVHVAGTNGKGSVSAMVETILRRTGVRTGLYTSPHLCRFNERIRIDGRAIDDDSFASALDRALADDRPPLTLFETMTVAAFLAFQRAGVEVAVLEVGLGGRLDATNVIEAPLACAITSIGLDHTRILGADLATIAREKAGIAKRGVPLVVGPVAPEAARAIAEVAHDRGAGPIVWIDGTAPTFTPAAEFAIDLRPSLVGRHQLANAHVAAAVAWQLRASLPGIETHIGVGIANTDWPGRLERIERGDVTVLLDCAHNVEGVEALCDHLGDRAPERTRLVFGALDDKPHEPMLDRLAPRCAHRGYAPAIEPSAGRTPADPAAMAARWPGEAHSSPESALIATLDAARPGDLVVVAGSVFLVGACRAHLLGLARDPAVPL